MVGFTGQGVEDRGIIRISVEPDGVAEPEPSFSG